MSRRDIHKKKKSSKFKVILLIILALAIISVLGMRYYIYSICKQYDNAIFPGVTIESVDLSGKTKEQAINLLNEKYGNEVLKKNIIIKTNNKNYKINYSKLNAKYNIIETVNEAFQYGRDKKILKKYKMIKNPSNKKYTLKFNYDGKYIDVLLDDIRNSINKKPKDATIRKAAGESFTVTPSKNGQTLNVDKLKKDINSSINGSINQKEIVIKAEINILKPKVQGEILSSVNSKVTTFNTTFNNSQASQNRVYNIKLAANSINGTLVMPGDTFSFNQVVGDRTKERGYKDAPVIVGNKVESGLGGGVCQVSSTLYNAVIRANIPSLERRNHTMPSSYVDKGLDATVSYGSIDYKFKNTLKYPVYLEVHVNENSLICSVYSNSSLKETTYDFASEIEETIPSKTVYVDDPSLAKGSEVIDVTAKNGYKVKVYKITYKNGKQISKQFLYEDYYKPVDGIIRRGTK